MDPHGARLWVDTRSITRSTHHTSTMFWCISATVFLILQTGRADGECDLTKAQQCQIDSNTRMLLPHIQCNNTILVPELTTCVNAHIDTCAQIAKDYWANQISVFVVNLAMIKADATVNCDLSTEVCLEESSERYAIMNCTTDLAANIAKIEEGASKGDNVSAFCTASQSAVTCLKGLTPMCIAAIVEKNAQLANYTAVDNHCTRGSSSDTERQEGLNMSALITSISLAVFILIVNAILIIVWLYSRRQSARAKRKSVSRGPMASRPVQYYY